MKKINRNKVISYLCKAIPTLEAIYFYGSYLTDSFTDKSDLDIAIKVEGQFENRKRWKTQEELASSIGRNVDLLNLNNASLVMQFEVVSAGERVFCDNDMEIQKYETLIYSRYLDFNQVRKPIIEQIQKTGSIYDSR